MKGLSLPLDFVISTQSGLTKYVRNWAPVQLSRTKYRYVTLPYNAPYIALPRVVLADRHQASARYGRCLPEAWVEAADIWYFGALKKNTF